MIIVEDNVVFESREAIEARVKDKWLEKGFSVSFEPYSVAQRLVDVWVDLLYDNQETVRNLYSRLSINASGTDLDNYLEKIGESRHVFPMLSFVWKNIESKITDRRFTFVRMPKEAVINPPAGRNQSVVRYNIRMGNKIVPINQDMAAFELIATPYEEYIQDMDENSDNYGNYPKERLFVVESDIIDVEVNVNNTNPNDFKPVYSETLYPHKGAYQSGREFQYSEASGSITYRNADTAYLALKESDDAVRSRIFTNGISIGACENMLNRICARSRVSLESEDVKFVYAKDGTISITGALDFKITMIGFEATEENIRAFWDICDFYLPTGWQLWNKAEAEDEARLIIDRPIDDGTVTVWVDTDINIDENGKKTETRTVRKSSNDLPVRAGFYFIDNPSMLYITGLSDIQRDVLTAGLPSIVSYPTIYIALGRTFTLDLLTNMKIKYNSPAVNDSGTVNQIELRKDESIYSRSTLERGSYFKLAVTK